MKKNYVYGEWKKRLTVVMMALLGTLNMAWADVEINETNFPDPTFRNILKGFSWAWDNKLTDAEIASIKELVLNVTGEKIDVKSLQGIEFFTALKKLECYNFNLTALDLSKNTALEKLTCWGNSLTSLDLSKNTALTGLSCGENQLTSLNVANCTELTLLACGWNPLDALDLTGCPNLTYLNISYCKISSLNLENNTALETLYCNGNELTSLNLSALTKLETLSVSDNQLPALDVSHNQALTGLSCSGMNHASLDVTNNMALTYLYCSGNRLTSLDISKNAVLTALAIDANDINTEAMGTIIADLPVVEEGYFYVIDDTQSHFSRREGNSITAAQLVELRSKGWTPYYLELVHDEEYGDYYEYMEYTGGTYVTAVEQLVLPQRERMSSVRYGIGGQRVDGSYKGVVIENGRKHIVK